MVFRGYNRAGHDFEWVGLLERGEGRMEGAKGEFRWCGGEYYEFG